MCILLALYNLDLSVRHHTMSAEINHEWPRPMETCGTYRVDVLKQRGHSNSINFGNEEAPIWMEMSSSHKVLQHLDNKKARQVHTLSSFMIVFSRRKFEIWHTYYSQFSKICGVCASLAEWG